LTDIAKPKRGGKEITAFFSRKMAWLSRLCRDPFITDAQFRVLYALVIEWLHNESDWCKPTDEKLGESCAKGERTIQRITAELKGEYIDKQKRLGPSQYVFIGLAADENEATPANLGGTGNSAENPTPAISGTDTRQTEYQDPPPVGRTKPSDLPSDLPSDSAPSIDGTYCVVEGKKEEASKEEDVEGKRDYPPASPGCPLEEVAEQLRRDPFIRDFCPLENLMVAAAEEAKAPGSGAALARLAANENWKAQRSA
jgi:hypothetical protein